MSLKKRVTTTIAILPFLCLIFLFAGEWIVGIVCLIGSLLATYESSFLLSKSCSQGEDNYFENIYLYLLGCALIYICSSLMFFTDKYFLYLPLISLIFFICSAKLLLQGKSFKSNINNALIFSFVILYCCLPWIIIWRIYCLADYAKYIFLLFSVVFATDIGAYFSGRAFGKTSLAPLISPNKTWEGVAGGVACAVAASMLFCYNLHIFLGNIWIAGLVGLLSSILCVIGDLVESSLKRCAKVKDSGENLSWTWWLFRSN
jgi:CDP-diglyceride synthetase